MTIWLDIPLCSAEQCPVEEPICCPDGRCVQYLEECFIDSALEKGKIYIPKPVSYIIIRVL